MKTKHRQISLVATGHPLRAAARVSTVLGMCLIFGLGLACRSHAQVLCGPLFEFYSATVRANAVGVEESGANPAEFIFEIVGGSPFGGTTLTLEIGGTASNGVDYQPFPTQVTLPGGPSPRVTRALVPIADALVEGTESVTVRIIDSSNANCIPIGTPNQATISITELSLATAVDNTNLLWTTGGDGFWSPQSAVTHDGVDAARSGPVTDDQESWLETTVSGPGTLTFWWKVSCEQNFDWLRFHIDGVLQHQISGEVNWQQRTYQIPVGPHVLRWRYLKDLSDSAGQDAAWVDDVRFTLASGSPTIASQPASHTVWPGANVSLSVVALGQAPLSHQWYFNETLPIVGATQPTLTLSNLRLANAGRYHVVVSNVLGSVPSSAATVTLTTNGPATSILLYVDGPFASPYETALTQLGRPFQMFTLATSFDQAVATANRNTTLVVVDATYYINVLTGVRNFIASGGRALVQDYSLIADASLATALGVTLERRFTTPQPVHDWSGSPFFRGLSSPLSLTDDKFIENGTKFHSLAGGYGVAGFGDPVFPGEATVVIGNAGRTIVNGFFLEDVGSTEDAIRFAQNQIQFLINPVLPIELLSASWIDGEFQFQIAGGRTGLDCSIEGRGDSIQWSTVTNVTLSAQPTLISVPASEPWTLYRAVTPPVP